MEAQRRGLRGVAFLLAALLALAVVATLVVLLATDASPEAFEDAALPLLAASLVSALAALAGWREERREAGRLAARELTAKERVEDEVAAGPDVAAAQQRIADLERELSQAAGRRAALEQQLVGEVESARGEAEESGRELEETRAKLRDTEQRLERERETRARTERARQLERDWNRELRDQVMRMHRERGMLGRTDDIRALVLHIAVTLLEAEKGMLLQKGDGGDLEVSYAEGFENDPRDSRLAQRFANEVIDRDTTVLEDSHTVDDDDGTPADAEIDNIAAIPIYVHDEFSGVVVCANRPGGFEDCDDQVLLAIGDQAGAVLENHRLRGGLRGAYLETVQVLADAIQAKDPHLRGHSEEVVQYVAGVAERLGIEPQRREELVFGSLLHDLGKIGISERILL